MGADVDSDSAGTALRSDDSYKRPQVSTTFRNTFFSRSENASEHPFGMRGVHRLLYELVPGRNILLGAEPRPSLGHFGGIGVQLQVVV